MEHEIVKREEMHFIGYKVQVDPKVAHVLIPALWDRFFREGITEKIPNKVADEPYGVYFDYEGDHEKPYTMMAGCLVTSLAEIPEGLTGHTAKATTYAHIEVIGAFPSALVQAWQEVWKSDLPRAFATDFEHYSPLFNRTPPRVDLYLSLKP